jgi:hypothetical protein
VNRVETDDPEPIAVAVRIGVFLPPVLALPNEGSFGIVAEIFKTPFSSALPWMVATMPAESVFNDDRDTLSRLPTAAAKNDRLARQVADLIGHQRRFSALGPSVLCAPAMGDRARIVARIQRKQHQDDEVERRFIICLRGEFPGSGANAVFRKARPDHGHIFGQLEAGTLYYLPSKCVERKLLKARMTAPTAASPAPLA